MEYMGHTQTAAYLAGPKLARSNTTMVGGWRSNSFRADLTYPAQVAGAQLQESNALNGSGDSMQNICPIHGPTGQLQRPVSGGYTGERTGFGEQTNGAGMQSRYTGCTCCNKYSMPDWMLSNQVTFRTSDQTRSGAELMRADAARLCNDVIDQTKKGQDDSKQKLGDRCNDIKFWKKEIQNELDGMAGDAAEVTKANKCLLTALSELEKPLNIALQCLAFREGRTGIDMVHDEVETELRKEVENMKKLQDELRQMAQETKDQASFIVAAQSDLERDAADKFAALKLDSSAQKLRNTSNGIKFHSGIEQVDNTISDPVTWEKFTSDNIQRSQKERAMAKEVRNRIEQQLSRTLTSLINQWNATNAAFTRRIQEYFDAQNKMQAHLQKVLQETFDVEKTIEFIKKCIKDQEAPLQMAQTRLAKRTDRPNVELCKDPAQNRLVREVYEISDSMEQLRAKLLEAENTLQELQRTRLGLEHNLAIKNNSIYIDREKCMGLRRSYHMATSFPCC